MTNSSNVSVDYSNILGFQKMTRDGFLVREDQQGHTLGYADVLLLHGKDLRFTGFGCSDLSFIDHPNLPKHYYNSFAHFIANLPTCVNILVIPHNHQDLKYMTFGKQIAYWKHILESVKSELAKYHDKSNVDSYYHELKQRELVLNRQIDHLKITQENLTDVTYALEVFDTTPIALTHDVDDLIYNSSLNDLGITRISNQHKWNLLYNLRNPLTPCEPKINQVPSDADKPTFTYDFMKQGKSYCACITIGSVHIDSFESLPMAWMLHILTHIDAVGCLSLGTKRVTKSAFMASDDQVAESYRVASIHLLVNDHITFKSLVRRVDRLRGDFYGMNLQQAHGKLQQKLALRSFYEPISEQMKHPINNSKLVKINVLGKGYPLAISKYKDLYGTYMGYTPSDGYMCLDPFKDSANRTIVFGDESSQKSLLAKKIMDLAIARGDIVRSFDPSGSYDRLTILRHGKVIRPDRHSLPTYCKYDVGDSSNNYQNDIVSNVESFDRIFSLYCHLETDLSDSQTMQARNSFVKWLHNRHPNMMITFKNFYTYATENNDAHKSSSSKELFRIATILKDRKLTDQTGNIRLDYDTIDNFDFSGFADQKTKLIQSFNYLDYLFSLVSNHIRECKRLTKMEHPTEKIHKLYLNFNDAEYWLNVHHPSLANAFFKLLLMAHNKYCEVTLTFNKLDVLGILNYGFSHNSENVSDHMMWCINNIFLSNYIHIFRISPKQQKGLMLLNIMSNAHVQSKVDLIRYERHPNAYKRYYPYFNLCDKLSFHGVISLITDDHYQTHVINWTPEYDGNEASAYHNAK